MTHRLGPIGSLFAMFGNPGDRYLWLTTYHTDLGGIPLMIMLESTEGWMTVQDYLNAARERGA